jgi:glycosyltransferase involved in cell wall biosynthesis
MFKDGDLMRVLIVHNQLWAHYKSKLFEEIHLYLAEQYPTSVSKVAQIGLYEAGRERMQTSDHSTFQYNYEVLFQKSLDQISFTDRLRALFQCFSHFKPDVLNITGYYDCAQILLMCYAKLLGVRVVLSSESSTLDHRRSPFKEWIKRLIVNRADAYFSFGTSSVEYLQELGVPLSKIAVRNAAVIDDQRVKAIAREEKANLTERKNNFIFVGRLSEEKNLLTLLKAYQQATKINNTRWGLLLVGDGPQRPQLEALVKAEKLENVTFAGGVSWLDVPKWLAKSRFLILPSFSEPWGLVVNEALVCGIPVIVSERCGCVKDLVVDGETGYIFNPDKVEELVKHLVHVSTLSDAEYASMSSQGEIIVSKFAAKKVAREMADTFVSLSNDRRSK